MTDSSPATADADADVPGVPRPPAGADPPAGTRPPAGRLGAFLGWARERASTRWAFVAALFVGSKLLLTLVGLLALHAYDGVNVTFTPDDTLMSEQKGAISPHHWLSMWYAWDSFIYQRLASEPLDGWHDFAFPLLYPFLARAVGFVLGGHTAIALLVVSNVAYVFLLYYAYRLAEQLLGDDAAARRFTRYVVLMPAAFLFQAALTESLFVGLALAAFFYAERRQWLIVGVVGFFLALSRSVGFLVVVPLALILLRQHDYRIAPRALRKALREYVRTGWPLVLVPAGWLSFMAFCRWKAGDWFAYKHAQEEGWNIVMHDPLRTLRDGLTVAEPQDAVRVWFAVIALVLVAVAFALRYLRPAYALYTLLMVVVPLTIGPPVYKSLIRYLLAAFPLCLVFARWARHATVDTYLTAALALTQGALFVVWLNYWAHFIV